MNILLTNDDGIHAEGLWALHDRLAPRHAVAVIAPDRFNRYSTHDKSTRKRVPEIVKVKVFQSRPATCTHERSFHGVVASAGAGAKNEF
jgi:broad specificity polyphosphatase/5'/3'-nucleotidase SurE